MVKYELIIMGNRESNYEISASNDNEFRKIALRKYGNAIKNAQAHLWGNAVKKQGNAYYIGGFTYHYKRWYWGQHAGGSFDFEIDPATGGKMVRYVEGYEVSYTTKTGKKVKKQLKYEGIEFTRYALMNYDTYKDAKRIFTIFKNGKKMGVLHLQASNGKWVWTTPNSKKYYIYVENGQVSSQIR